MTQILKTYNIMSNIGRAKYVVNFRDGIKTHRDGSPFSDIAVFSNKRKFAAFLRKLRADGFLSR